MSLISLKPRPIPSRDKDPDRLRDDRLFIIACDDTYAPDQYFSFFKLTRIRISVIPTQNGTSVAAAVLQRLLEYKYEIDDERWMLLDTDHLIQGTHLRGLKRALRDAKNHGIKVALSKPSFELWLLLHHVPETSVGNLSDATAVEAVLHTTLGGYDKTKLKKVHYPLAALVLACQRATLLDQYAGNGTIPHTNASRIYKIWHAIIAKALLSQLPTELHGLSNNLNSNVLNSP